MVRFDIDVQSGGSIVVEHKVKGEPFKVIVYFDNKKNHYNSDAVYMTCEEISQWVQESVKNTFKIEQNGSFYRIISLRLEKEVELTKDEKKLFIRALNCKHKKNIIGFIKK